MGDQRGGSYSYWHSIRFENLPMMIRFGDPLAIYFICGKKMLYENRWWSCDYHRVVIIMWSSLYRCIMLHHIASLYDHNPCGLGGLRKKYCHRVEVQNPSGYVKVLWGKPTWPAWHSMAGLEMIYPRGISRFASPGQGVSKSTTVKIINVSDLSRRLILIWKLEDFPIMSTRD